MKIAIPVFHTKISPRFDETQTFVLVETESSGVVARERLVTKGWADIDKMKQLVRLGVDTLICGGIDRACLQYLSFNGIHVYSWVTGEVEDAVACFLQNRMKPGVILGDNGVMKERWQFCKGKNHLCNMFQTGVYQNRQEVRTMPRGDGTGPKGQGPRSGLGRGGCRGGKEGCGGVQGKVTKGGLGDGLGDGLGGGPGSGQGKGRGTDAGRGSRSERRKPAERQ